MKSRICTASECLSDTYEKTAVTICEDPSRIHRKIWEFYAIIAALHDDSMLVPGKRGIGFAVGTEPLSAYFAQQGCHITASDYIDENSTWKNNNQLATSKDCLNQRGICDADRFAENVSFRHIDMNDIPADECTGTYDFLWSSCAMEHIGSLQHGIHFVRNSLACLKPGGLAMHTTEFNCSSNEETLEKPGLNIYRKQDIEYLSQFLTGAGTLYPMDFCTGNHELDMHIDTVPYSQTMHLKLDIHGFVTTSCILLIRKI